MASSASRLISATHSNVSFRRFKYLGPICDSVALVLLPSLIALIISAALVGHGHISGDSILDVLNQMARSSASSVTAP